MNERQKLPDTRRSITHKFVINASDGKYKGYLTVGLYDDGRPGEIFVKIAKVGSVMNGLLTAWCRSTSFVLQFGVPVEKLVEMFTDMKFEPSDDKCTSIIDYIVRFLTTIPKPVEPSPKPPSTAPIGPSETVFLGPINSCTYWSPEQPRPKEIDSTPLRLQ